MVRSYTTCWIKSFLKPLEKIGFTTVPYAIGQNFLEGLDRCQPGSAAEGWALWAKRGTILPFSKEILPKTLTPHFCKSLFLHNSTHEWSVTYCRAETYTESSDENTQSSPKTLASFSFFHTKLIVKRSVHIIHNKSYDECYTYLFAWYRRRRRWISRERPPLAPTSSGNRSHGPAKRSGLQSSILSKEQRNHQ